MSLKNSVVQEPYLQRKLAPKPWILFLNERAIDCVSTSDPPVILDNKEFIDLLPP